ncbi:hypothetical protein [Roseibium sediminicola]|uniref:DUF4760 domain-containing protein n=1 Tax=Roseibium sediminicola TaxID=2933272 RepID=A0ABT0GRS2_9HYPH|nr:hypothetical protein [Roseibium sp. CAU 1639]MCK7611981.1 hypothetical protein [Roseibium sp. CAU 1639]
MSSEMFRNAIIFFTLLMGVFVGFVFGTATVDASAGIRNWLSATSGWAAAVAAVVTVFVLLHQIRKSETIAHRRSTEANQLFKEETIEVLHRFNRIWKHAEDTKTFLEAGQSIENYVKALKSELNRIDRQLRKEEYEEYLRLALPMAHAKGTKVLRLMRRVASEKEIPTYNVDGAEFTYVPDDEEWLELLLMDFALMRRALTRLYPDLSEIFANRDHSADRLYQLGKASAEAIGIRQFPDDKNNPL